MREFAQKVLALLGKSEAEIRMLLAGAGSAFPFDPESVHKLGLSVVLTAGSGAERRLLVVADCNKRLPDGFEGERFALDDGGVLLCGAFSAVNAAALRRHFPWCAPKQLPGGGRTVGFGAGEGAGERLCAVRSELLFPVFSAASDEAVFLVFSGDFRNGYGVDGGRVSTLSGAERAFASGATVVLLRPSGGDGSEEYAGKQFVLSGGRLEAFDRSSAEHCCFRCGGLAGFAAKLAAAGAKRDLGIALDESEEPTTPAEHLFAVRELRKRNVDFSILFLRWPEEPAAFEEMLRRHAAVARTFEGYRLAVPLEKVPSGLHSLVGRQCGEMLHMVLGEAAGGEFKTHFRRLGLKER